jgi:2-aminoadipate transaminase
MPEIISFAGGLPAPELFPVEEILDACAHVLREDGPAALQYAATEGYPPLRAWIADRLNKTRGTSFDADNILITSGSQQALDLSGKVFLDEGDVVLCESPTYLAAITAFRAYGCRFREVPTDGDGMLMDALEETLYAEKRAKLIYVIPDFQNPTGRTWSRARREALCRLARSHRVVIMEDDPYGELRFEGEQLPSVKSFDRNGQVFYFGTFSKIFCPAPASAGARGRKRRSVNTFSSSRGRICKATHSRSAS